VFFLDLGGMDWIYEDILFIGVAFPSMVWIMQFDRHEDLAPMDRFLRSMGGEFVTGFFPNQRVPHE